MPRRFTLTEARKMLPVIDRLMQEAIEAKSEYEQAERSLQVFKERIMLMGGIVVDREQAGAERRRREHSAAQLKQCLERIQETGCVVKDLDIGLVDFPSIFRGEEVYLCWKLGESDIEFWHGIDEGFAGRKRIDRDFEDHHEGDARQ